VVRASLRRRVGGEKATDRPLALDAENLGPVRATAPVRPSRAGLVHTHTHTHAHTCARAEPRAFERGEKRRENDRHDMTARLVLDVRVGGAYDR
jgi:hypothetical protein